MSRLLSMAVVVPARDEERVLAGCLASVDLARRSLEQSRPDVAVTVLVVLDRCVDRSASLAAQHPGVDTLVVSVGCVGAARAAGAALVLAGSADTGRLWLASTDADSVVPPHWLEAQADLADSGRDLVLGTVEPVGVDAHLLGRWARRHRLRDGHPHVHGANLGVRASRYVEVGGFPGVGLHEDVLLAAAVKATGASWVATDATRVQTAGRLDGRVSGGFATYLRELADEPEALPAVL
ncbi:MAG: glycosyltransferase [Pedococcus sp.]